MRSCNGFEERYPVGEYFVEKWGRVSTGRNLKEQLASAHPQSLLFRSTMDFCRPEPRHDFEHDLDWQHVSAQFYKLPAFTRFQGITVRRTT